MVSHQSLTVAAALLRPAAVRQRLVAVQRHPRGPTPGTAPDAEDRFGLWDKLFEQWRDDRLELSWEIGEKHQSKGERYDKKFVCGFHMLPPMSANG